MSVLVVFKLDRWDHAEFAVESPAVKPVDVFDRRNLEVLDAAPWTAVADQFGFEDRVHRLREGIVVVVTLGPDGHGRARYREPFCVTDGSIRGSAVVVMDQLRQIAALALPGSDSHVERVEDEIGAHVPGQLPPTIRRENT